jgi:hypothetical protein
MPVTFDPRAITVEFDLAEPIRGVWYFSAAGQDAKLKQP